MWQRYDGGHKMIFQIVSYIVFLAIMAISCAFFGGMTFAIMNPLEKLPSKVKGLTSTRIVITLAIIFAIFIETGVIFIVSCFAAANVLDMYFSDLSLAGLFVASYGFVMLFLNIGIRQRKKNIPAHNGRI